MYYDPKYDAMPLRGKISPKAWEIENYGRWEYGERTRRYWRKYNRHYDHTRDWWSDDTIGLAYRHVMQWWANAPSKGHKRKTWRDYK